MINMVLMDCGYLDTGVMKKVESLNLTYIIPAKDHPKVLIVNTNFVHVIYYANGKKHHLLFYNTFAFFP